MTGSVGEFERHRPRLRGLAYRMLGSVADADDVLQDAYLRWHGTDETVICEPLAWLTTVVSRLCIDRLRAVKAQRDAYVGPWLPEPWLDDPPPSVTRPDARQDQADDLSVAFLLLLERLSPDERAAFLLRDVFEIGYPEIAVTLNRSEAACRQMVHRAREPVRAGTPRVASSDAERQALLARFMEAVTARDEQRVLDLLTPDATLISDGGGKAWAALKPIRGASKIARLFVSVAGKFVDTPSQRILTINGASALVTWVGAETYATTSIDVVDGRIVALYQMMNPDKLVGIAATNSSESKNL